MTRKRTRRASASQGTVAMDRAVRLHRLLSLLAKKPHSREELCRLLGIDVRGFYRDLELLRESGIKVPLRNRCYLLGMEPAAALDQLPFPDAHLTLGEARALAAGKGSAHRKLRGLIAVVVGKSRQRKR
jgi:biotin operon repressor